MKSLIRALTLLSAITLSNHTAFAESETSSRGELRLESRFFNDDDNSATQDFGYGMAGRIEVDHSWKDISSRVQVFSRVDRKDSTRQRLNIEELYSQWIKEEWVLFAGFKTLNWSTAEAFHPTDVINSRNFDSPVENAEKLGELMVGFQYLSEFVNFSAFYMPMLNRPQLPLQSNRLSFAPQIPGVNVQELQFVDNQGNLKDSDDFVEQWALRAQIPIDDWEFNFYWVHHFDRTDFGILSNLGAGTVNPLLSEVDHFAFSFQFVWESWIFKSENAYRNFQENVVIPSLGGTLNRSDYGISSLALEYLWPHESGSETTFIVEFQEIYGTPNTRRYLINPFQRDLFVGARHAWNDINGKELFVGLISDLERSRELLASISYSQRLSDVWKIKTGLRYIDAPGPVTNFTGLRPLNNDHQFDLTLSRYF